MNDLVPAPTLRELAELMEGNSVRVIVEVTPAALNEELATVKVRLADAEQRLAFHDQLRERRDQIRYSNLKSRAKHLALELTFIAEERGDFLADYQIAEICRTTGLSPKTIDRAQLDLMGAKLIQTLRSGQGAGNRKLVDLLISKTVTEIASLIEVDAETKPVT